MKKLLAATVVLTVLGAALAGCATPTPEIIKETIVVTQVVKETVVTVVEGTPKVVEKEVTKVVEMVVTATPEPAPEPTPEPAPKRGGTLIMAYENEPRSFNIWVTPGSAEWVLAGNVYCTLVIVDADFNIIPHLADSWEISADLLTYTFHLNPNAMWHDGEPVTSADLEYSAKEVFPTSPVTGYIWEPYVESFEVPDEYTFVVTLKEPWAPFLMSMTDSAFAPLPKHLYEGTDFETNPLNWAPVGNGPFKFNEWSKGSYIELVRNENYFKPDKPYLDRLIIQVVPDANSRLLAFERGEVDFLHSYIVPFDRIPSWRQDPGVSVVDFGLGVGTLQLLLQNLDNEYLQNPQVRKALAYAIDQNELAEIALFGVGKPATSIMASNQPYYDGSFDVYERDLDKANQLLDEAGFPKGSDGKRFALRLAVKTGADYEERAAQVIKSQLGDLGIDVEISLYDLAVYVEAIFINRDFDMAVQLYVTGPDPALSVSYRYAKDGIGDPYSNAMGWVNEEYEQIIVEESRQDEATRREMWVRAQEILMDELPVIPLYEMPNVNVHSSKFRDVITDAVYGYISQPREDAYMVGE